MPSAVPTAAISELEESLSEALKRTFAGNTPVTDLRRAIALHLLAMSSDDQRAASEADLNTEAETSTEVDQSGQWSIVQWIHSLELPRHVARSLTTPPGVESFKYVTEILTRSELSRKLASGGLEGLTGVLWSGVAKLQQQGASTASELNSKFADDGATQMA
jgi:hypothetical protein